jgi:mono/diheme cytochrome c family protein
MRFARPFQTLGTLAAGASIVALLSGCEVKNTAGDAANGKKLFVQKCGSCHILRRAGTKGVTGPNLDEAFQQPRRDGFPSSSIRGLVNEQILYPNRTGVMPAKLFTGQDAHDVATYVATVAGQPGQDTGALDGAGRQVLDDQPDAEAGQIRVLLRRAGPRAGRHEGHPDSQVAASATRCSACSLAMLSRAACQKK